MSVTLLSSTPLTTSFQPSAALLVSGETVVLDFTVVVANTGAALLGRIEWYLEFTSGDPLSSTTRWFREVAEEDAGDGDVKMPKVIRRFTEQGGTNLAVGNHYFNVQFVRKHLFVRVQIRQAATFADACTARIDSDFGDLASL